jgi:hypothetical protein
MLCMYPQCTQPAHPLFNGWCEDHWVEQSRLQGSNSVIRSNPTRERRNTNDCDYRTALLRDTIENA